MKEKIQIWNLKVPHYIQYQNTYRVKKMKKKSINIIFQGLKFKRDFSDIIDGVLVWFKKYKNLSFSNVNNLQKIIQVNTVVVLFQNSGGSSENKKSNVKQFLNILSLLTKI